MLKLWAHQQLARSAAGTALVCQREAAGQPRRLLALRRLPDRQGWQLSALTESSAAEKLQQLLLAEQWEGALMLAETHDLDQDLVRRYTLARDFVPAHP